MILIVCISGDDAGFVGVQEVCVDLFFFLFPQQDICKDEEKEEFVPERVLCEIKTIACIPVISE